MPDESTIIVSGNHSIKKRLAKNVLRAARRTGFLHVYSTLRSRLVKRKVAILAYHRIDWATRYPWSITPNVTPDNFDLEMRYLHQRYHIISLDELSNNLSDLKVLHPNTAVVTIDDGYRDVYLYAYPILREFNTPATVFLTTGNIDTGNLFWTDKVSYIIWKTKLETLEIDELGTHHLTSDNERNSIAHIVVEGLKQLPVKERDEFIERLVRLSGVDIPKNLGEELILSWDEVREMSRNGINFGAHTVNHPILTRIPLETARKEILDSKRRLEEELDQEVTTFCYPNGTPGDFNDDIEDILKSNGFRCAVTYLPQAFVSPGTQLYRLPRITGTPSFDTFELFISGLYLDVVDKW